MMLSDKSMSRIVVQNTTVLTLDERDTFYYPGYIDIRDDKIFKVGEWSLDTILDDCGETKIIDGTDKLVMPGLVDLHFHTSVAKVRGLITHLSLDQTNDDHRVMGTTCLSGNTSTGFGTPRFGH